VRSNAACIDSLPLKNPEGTYRGRGREGLWRKPRLDGTSTESSPQSVRTSPLEHDYLVRIKTGKPAATAEAARKRLGFRVCKAGQTTVC